MINTITLGTMTFHLYGLFMGVAIVVGWNVAARIADELYQIETKIFDRIAVWAILGGIIGARFYHVIDFWNYYSLHMGEILKVWHGGLGIYGAILGGLLGIWLSSIKFGKLLKLVASITVVLPISQAIGRLGNFVNQELYGEPTNLPWGIFIDSTHRLPGLENYNYFHPLFAYEAILNLGLGTYLYLNRKKLKPNKIIGYYLLGYGTIRILLEPMRPVMWKIGDIPTASIVSLLLMLIGLGLLLKQYED